MTGPEIRPADKAVRKMFYRWMKQQFPPDELKPLSAIEDLCARGIYQVYGLWLEDEPVAYALFGRAEEGRRWLLDYYAVLPGHQAQGWGTRFLGMLREKLDGDDVLIEVEDPDLAQDPEEARLRRRRMEFYLRCGCVDSGVRLWLFGVDYAVLTMPLSDEDTGADARRGMEEIYRAFLPERIYRMNVHFRD